MHLGRQDYTEPALICADHLALIRNCVVTVTANKTTWNDVQIDGKLIGYVTSRTGGQMFRTPDMGDWIFAANDWNRADPPFAHALLALILYINEGDGQP